MIKDYMYVGEDQELFLEQFSRDEPELEDFCQKYSVDLVRVDTTFENERLELMYFFTDERGGYTIKGVKGSLDKG